VYQPILGVANVVYTVLYALLGRPVTFQLAFVHLLLLGLQLYAYFGILDDAASRPKEDDKLAGGASLDLLGAVLLLQYLGGLLHHRFLYLLGLLPIWGGWKLYALFYGGKTNDRKRAETVSPASADQTTSDDGTQRRQRRAEKRQQKWS
jgi:SRP-independent targeting protein 2/TMEM208